MQSERPSYFGLEQKEIQKAKDYAQGASTPTTYEVRSLFAKIKAITGDDEQKYNTYGGGLITALKLKILTPAQLLDGVDKKIFSQLTSTERDILLVDTQVSNTAIINDFNLPQVGIRRTYEKLFVKSRDRAAVLYQAYTMEKEQTKLTDDEQKVLYVFAHARSKESIRKSLGLKSIDDIKDRAATLMGKLDTSGYFETALRAIDYKLLDPETLVDDTVKQAIKILSPKEKRFLENYCDAAGKHKNINIDEINVMLNKIGKKLEPHTLLHPGMAYYATKRSKPPATAPDTSPETQLDLNKLDTLDRLLWIAGKTVTNGGSETKDTKEETDEETDEENEEETTRDFPDKKMPDQAPVLLMRLSEFLAAEKKGLKKKGR